MFFLMISRWAETKFGGKDYHIYQIKAYHEYNSKIYDRKSVLVA